eukprot:c4978_g1_i2.p1 GENE.c4978_g1_i2~~c4978_g1_i2.p1  ORF type:complete len:121 (+),score=21.59 c4978_g1_i2:55-417(+)
MIPIMAMSLLLFSVLFVFSARIKARIRRGDEVRYLATHPPPPTYRSDSKLPAYSRQGLNSFSKILYKHKLTLKFIFELTMSGFFATIYSCSGIGFEITLPLIMVFHFVAYFFSSDWFQFV